MNSMNQQRDARDYKNEVRIKIFQENDPKKILDYVKNELKFDITNNQIRNFFDEVKRLKNRKNVDDVKKHTYRLILMVEYAKKKQSNKKYGIFFDLMSGCLSFLIDNPTEENYKKFEEFLEAIIAFHGKDK